MALTLGLPEKEGVLGDLKYQVRKVTFDNSYPTAGEALTATDLGLSDILAVIDCGPAVASTPITRKVSLVYDDVNSKLQAFGSVLVAVEYDAEVANATDLSTVIHRLLVFGK